MTVLMGADFYDDLQVAMDEGTSPRLLKFMARKNTTGPVAQVVAANPSTPQDTIRTLAGSTDPLVRASVASNLSTPGDVLLALSGDQSPAVQQWLSKRTENNQDATTGNGLTPTMV